MGNESVRAFASTTIVYGEIAAQCRIYSAAARPDPAWRLMAPSGGPVQTRRIDGDTNEEILPGVELMRCHEPAKGELVTLSPAEWAAVHDWPRRPETEILSWHPASAAPHWMRDRCYYLAPARGRAQERAYATLVGAVGRARCVGLCLWAPRADSRPVWAVLSLLSPMRLVIWTLHPPDGVRAPSEAPGAGQAEDPVAALELARRIIAGAGPLDHSACIDPIEARLKAAIEARRSGRVPGPEVARAIEEARGAGEFAERVRALEGGLEALAWLRGRP